jgi:hypothetical protein
MRVPNEAGRSKTASSAWLVLEHPADRDFAGIQRCLAIADHRLADWRRKSRGPAHRHPDERVAMVVSGIWHFGFGKTFDPTHLRALPPGSFYTEPPNEDHFAETEDSEVQVQISNPSIELPSTHGKTRSSSMQ